MSLSLEGTVVGDHLLLISKGQFSVVLTNGVHWVVEDKEAKEYLSFDSKGYCLGKDKGHPYSVLRVIRKNLVAMPWIDTLPSAHTLKGGHLACDCDNIWRTHISKPELKEGFWMSGLEGMSLAGLKMPLMPKQCSYIHSLVSLEELKAHQAAKLKGRS